MLFNTLEFVFFLPVVIILYYLIPHKFRWAFLLAASYYFYMCWNAAYILLIFSSTIIDYISGIQMEKQSSKKRRRPYLILSLLTNLGLLFTFKYYGFFSGNINVLFDSLSIPIETGILDVMLPVGISFYTFQTLSYSIDVYQGRQKAERHFGYFALYVSFFPQLVAGPIERFSRLTPQLKKKHTFTFSNMQHGLRLILFGLFVKMVIADNISIFVDQFYQNPSNYSSLDAMKAIFLYSFQIYGDFFGYSIIAIGSARLMGITLIDNFKTPYLSTSIAEFWQRWHISLSTWFRDYLYFPLGGNKVRTPRWITNVLIVFVLSGIWHGANWTFIIWGALYGVIYMIEKGFEKLSKGLKREHIAYRPTHLLLAIKTFVLVSLIWVFFRSQNFTEAMTVFESLFTHIDTPSVIEIPWHISALLAVFILSDFLLYNNSFDTWISRFPLLVRWGVYSFLAFCIIVFSGVENAPFIYFQF